MPLKRLHKAPFAMYGITRGLCGQALHLGPYSEEPAPLARMEAFAKENSYILHGRHHEVYLGDPRRLAPEKLKTILRHLCSAREQVRIEPGERVDTRQWDKSVTPHIPNAVLYSAFLISLPGGAEDGIEQIVGAKRAEPGGFLAHWAQKDLQHIGRKRNEDFGSRIPQAGQVSTNHGFSPLGSAFLLQPMKCSPISIQEWILKVVNSQISVRSFQKRRRSNYTVSHSDIIRWVSLQSRLKTQRSG